MLAFVTRGLVRSCYLLGIMSTEIPSVFEPPNWLEREQEVLAPYAMQTRYSRGRRHEEEPHPSIDLCISATVTGSSIRPPSAG